MYARAVVIGREQLIRDIEAARVAHLVEEAADQSDVVARHVSLPWHAQDKNQPRWASASSAVSVNSRKRTTLPSRSVNTCIHSQAADFPDLRIVAA